MKITSFPSALEQSDENFVRNRAIENILERVLHACDLPDRYRKVAEEHYHEKAEHLKKTRPFGAVEVTIKPQGSMSMGTTVPPLNRSGQSFDIDMLIRVEQFSSQMNPKEMHRSLGRALMQGFDEAESIKLGWQIDYSDTEKMHVDVIPVTLHRQTHEETILAACDWERNSWKETNPEGYTRLFLADADRLPIFRQIRKVALNSRNLEESFANTTTIEPLPDFSRFKRPLQRVVQLAKRHRDVWFSTGDRKFEQRPASIVISTILWQHYKSRVADQHFGGISEILTSMAGSLVDGSILQADSASTGRMNYTLANPTLWDERTKSENLVAKWNTPNGAILATAYNNWARAFYSFVEDLLRLEGIPNLSTHLKQGLGEGIVSPAVQEIARLSNKTQRPSVNIQATPRLGAVLGAAVSVARAVPPHTFYGIRP
jgi:hypothetical protein